MLPEAHVTVPARPARPSPPDRLLRRLARRIPIRAQLLGIAVVAGIFLVGLAGATILGVMEDDRTDQAARDLSTVHLAYEDGARALESLRRDAGASARAAAEGRAAQARDHARDALRDAAQVRADLSVIDEVAGSERAIEAGRSNRKAVTDSADAMVDLAQRAAAGEDGAVIALRREVVRAAPLAAAWDRDLAAVEGALRDAQATALRDSDALVRHVIESAVIALIGLLALAYLISRSILARLAAVAGVATRVAGGDLEARNGGDGSDEIAALGRAIDEMADSLTRMVDRLREEAERETFGSQVAEALEICDDERGVLDAVGRAMPAAAPATPVELLLADSSTAHLHRAASTSAVPPPGCAVGSPFECIAVRRGSPAVFASSEALNACPWLRDREGGPCSGVCIPVLFMGRSVGVLHATGGDGVPPDAATVDRLATLAGEVGSRIGTVRAFATSQLQASTDGLTGLLNRRTLENRLQALIASGTDFALAMCDLDRFKALNDAHGHEAGDRALRLFARVLRRSLRAEDIVARHGGEEFVLVLPGMSPEEAVSTMDRIRFALSASLSTGEAPGFTASFGVVGSGRAGGMDELLAIADRALYAAKEAGRDRVVVAGDHPAYTTAQA